MQINPMNIINLLLVAFQALNIQETPITSKEIEIKERIEDFLLSAIHEFNEVDIVVDESLDFQEPFKEFETEIVEDRGDVPISKQPTEVCTSDGEEISFEYKLRAVEYWRSGKTKNLSVETVKQKFKKVQSDRQLRRWAHTVNQGGTYREKIARICDFTLENFKAATQGGFIIHDVDLQKWALQAKKEIGFEDIRFKASKTWVKEFKRVHRIVSRKINKFITKKTLENKDELDEKAITFVNDVKAEISANGVTNVYNSDQSGFQLEMHSGRTLAIEGEKNVQCLVQSVSATTHSYTIQPTISADGRLLSPLYLVLKEPTGKFGPIVEAHMFRPSNVYIMASKSGKLTSVHFKTWLKDVYFPHVESNSVLLIDSWSGHCPQAVAEVTPPSKTVKLKLIPTGTTGKIQPLDVYGFRTWKNYVRHFSDSAMLMNQDTNLHIRNNIIKLQSLIHNQLSSPRYNNLFKYSWHKSGYVDIKPESFEDPVDFSFGDSCNTRCEVPGCENVGFIRCSWCKKTFCFKHFYEDYHYCSTYEN